MKKVLSGVAIGVLLASCLAYAYDEKTLSALGNWQFVTESDEQDKFYIDTTTVTRDDKLVSAKVKMIPSKLTQDQMMKQGLEKADALIMYTDFYCDKKQYLDLYLWIYRKDELIGTVPMSDPLKELGPDLPNETIYQYVCSKF